MLEQSSLHVPPSTIFLNQKGFLHTLKREPFNFTLGQQHVIAFAGIADVLGAVGISWRSQWQQSSDAWMHQPVVVALGGNSTNITIK